MIQSFRHEIFLHGGQSEFLAGAVPFIHEGQEAGAGTLVMVSSPKSDALRSELGRRAKQITFLDAATACANPARIIPTLRDFMQSTTSSNKHLRAITEPAIAQTEPARLIEVLRHEPLLNTAIGSSESLWLLCSYDTTTTDPDALEEAAHHHPFVLEEGGHQANERYPPPQAGPLAEAPLSEPDNPAQELRFSSYNLGSVRELISTWASRRPFSPGRCMDLVQAVNELTTNSVLHAQGGGRFRIWEDQGGLVCEVTDSGHISNPLAGTELPGSSDVVGRGLWMVNQLCDLVQIRSLPGRTVIRVHMRFD